MARIENDRALILRFWVPCHIWLGSVLICACTPVKFSNTVPGQPKAKYYSFHKKNGGLINNLLDTSVIYVYQSELVKTYQSGKAEKFFGHVYLLFKSNGMAYYSDYSEQPFDQINIYTIGGQYCFYKVEGDELQLEFYDFNLRRFTIVYGKISADKVYFYKDRLRMFWGGKDKRNMSFIKSSIKYTHQLMWPE